MILNSKNSEDSFHSPFYQMNITLKVALLPHQSSNILQAIQNQIHKLLFNYHEDLEGVPMTYSSIKFTKGKEFGRIMGEHPWVHVDVETKIILFKPVIGAILNGKVTMVSDSHVSIIIFDTFNASMSSDSLKSKQYNYNENFRHWESDNSVIAENDFINFSISSFQQSFGVLNISAIPN